MDRAIEKNILTALNRKKKKKKEGEEWRERRKDGGRQEAKVREEEVKGFG